MAESLENPEPVDFDDSENYASNTSGNRPFSDIMAAASSRRSILRGTLASAATGFLAPSMASAQSLTWPRNQNRELVDFKEVTIAQASVDQTLPTISDDYTYQSFIPWGTPIEPGATTPYEGDPSSRPSSEEAALQVGIGHDGIFFFPDTADIISRGVEVSRYPGVFPAVSNNKGMLCVNHEFGLNTHVLGKPAPQSLEDVRLAQNVMGVSVIAIQKRGRFGTWEVINSPNTRRITPNTPVKFSGPVAGSALLENPEGNVPLGTINNCGAGITPWGTYLTCEENFNGYFGSQNTSFTPTTRQARYGLTRFGFGFGWFNYDKRFELDDPDYANEVNRFGWVVEIDPYDGTQTPVKRTAMGRFKHEAVAIGVSGNGRIAAYMGDDQQFDYCYKFKSDRPWKTHIARGESPLDHGTLYAAKFNANGRGVWLELSMNVPALAAEFDDMAELLINTRIAADIVGATPMDRPEWASVASDGSVFWSMTNNSARTTPNPPNPEAPNRDGHIIKLKDARDFLGNTFTWEIYILSSSTQSTDGVFTDPDAAYVDPQGRLFIGTDGRQPDGLQNQVVVFDTTKDTPEPKRLLVGVVRDEITGWGYTPDYRTAFVNVQHPGNGDPSRTNFPKAFDGFTIPRDATLIITRKDGGVVGS